MGGKLAGYAHHVNNFFTIVENIGGNFFPTPNGWGL